MAFTIATLLTSRRHYRNDYRLGKGQPQPLGQEIHFGALLQLPIDGTIQSTPYLLWIHGLRDSGIHDPSVRRCVTKMSVFALYCNWVYQQFPESWPIEKSCRTVIKKKLAFTLQSLKFPRATTGTVVWIKDPSESVLTDNVVAVTLKHKNRHPQALTSWNRGLSFNSSRSGA